MTEIGTGREEGYFLNVVMAFSKVATALFTGANHNVYFSAQAGRWLEQNKLRGKFFVPIINYIFNKWKGDIDHCQKSWYITKLLLKYEKEIRLDGS